LSKLYAVDDILCGHRIFKDRRDDMYVGDTDYVKEIESDDIIIEFRVNLSKIVMWEQYVDLPSNRRYKNTQPKVTVMYDYTEVILLAEFKEMDSIMKEFNKKNLLTFTRN
jgi:hypothetical protein